MATPSFQWRPTPSTRPSPAWRDRGWTTRGTGRAEVFTVSPEAGVAPAQLSPTVCRGASDGPVQRLAARVALAPSPWAAGLTGGSRAFVKFRVESGDGWVFETCQSRKGVFSAARYVGDG